VGILTEEMKRRHRDSAHRQGTAEDVSLTTFCRYEGLQADETTGSSSPATICGVVDRAGIDSVTGARMEGFGTERVNVPERSTCKPRSGRFYRLIGVDTDYG
jgi:hypothetical protein